MEVGLKGNAKYTVCHAAAYHSWWLVRNGQCVPAHARCCRCSGKMKICVALELRFISLKIVTAFIIIIIVPLTAWITVCVVECVMALYRFREVYHPLWTDSVNTEQTASVSISSTKFTTPTPLHPRSPPPAVKYSGFVSGMLDYCAHLAWTQASGAWSIHCSTWVKVMESSLSLLCSPMSKHMVTEHLEHVWVTRTT